MSAASKVWIERFQQLYHYTRNQLLDLRNVDINAMHDEKSLEAWHRSIDIDDPHAIEISTHIIFLKSITWMEQENITSGAEALNIIGKQNVNLRAARAVRNGGVEGSRG